jgi:hypothetical protein
LKVFSSSGPARPLQWGHGLSAVEIQVPQNL